MQTKAFVHPGWFSSKMDQFYNFVMKKVTRGKMRPRRLFGQESRYLSPILPSSLEKAMTYALTLRVTLQKNDSVSETSLD